LDTMKAFAHWISNRSVAWTVVAVVTIMAGAGLFQLRNIQQDDDILAFLPKENPDVGLFYDVNKRFGSLDLALVGVETEDVFDPAFLGRLKRVTKELKDISGLDHVLSLANVVDFRPDLDKGGIVTAPTIRTIPKTSEEIRDLRAHVMSKDHLVGNLVSADAKAVQVLCFLAYGADPREMAAAIRSKVEEVFPQAWPLQDGNITCQTCHDVLLPMKADPLLQSANPAFLRGAPYETLSDFCFACDCVVFN